MRFITSFGMTMVLVLLLSCIEKQPESIVAEPEPLPFEIDKNLQAIDTLLQTDAVNALQELLSFDTQSVIFNENYHKLLLAESLFKTDNPQYYRIELQAAMHYFDSLAARYPGNDDIIVLSARSHYMNGVGFYENDSVVDACKEYLRTLEIMESHFDVDTHGHASLRGYKAKFMGLTYNRLKELFTNQLMMEPAIYCGKKALFYCKIAPTSKYGISNNLAKLGEFYDVLGETDTAYYYYDEALKALPDTNNLIYRDLVSSMVLLSYELGCELKPLLRKMFQVAKHAESNDELLTRYYVIGWLYYEGNIYDSASVYLERVFGNNENIFRKQQAADFLMKIYQKSGDTINLNKYSIYLAQNAISNYENSFDTSTLSELFQDHLDTRLQQLQKRNMFRLKIVKLIYIALTIVLVCVTLIFSLKRFNKLNKKYHRSIETLKKAKYREKAKMLVTIKQHEAKVNVLEQELGHKRSERDLIIIDFLKEPVCKKIKGSLESANISTGVSYVDYHRLKLDEATISELDDAVTRYFPNFRQCLFTLCPQLKQEEILLCQLYLLGFKDNQISYLMQYNRSTIFRKAKKIKKALGISVNLTDFLQNTAVL